MNIAKSAKRLTVTAYCIQYIHLSSSVLLPLLLFRGTAVLLLRSTKQLSACQQCQNGGWYSGVIVPISTLVRIPWFSHHTFFSRTAVATENKSVRRLPIIINLLKFVVLSSLRCLVPVRFSIIVTR